MRGPEPRRPATEGPERLYGLPVLGPLGRPDRRGVRRRRRPPGGFGIAGLLAMAVGVGVILLGPLVEPAAPGLLTRPFTGLLGAAVSLIGLRFAMEAWWPDGGRMGGWPADGGEAWMRGYRWRRTGMPPFTGGVGHARMVVGRLGFVVLIGLFNAPFFDLASVEGSRWLLFLIVPMLDLLALAVLLDSLPTIAQRLRFGSPRIELETFPAPLGGELRARIRAGRRLRPRGTPTATLTCVREAWVSVKRAGGMRPEVQHLALYRDVREVALPPDADHDARDAIEVTFAVPAEAPATRLDAEEPTYWLLGLRVPVRGPDVSPIFLVPVCEPPRRP